VQYLSLFSGIGGLDLAAHWVGFRPAAFVERDGFCQKVLAKHWPGTPIYGDVRTFNAAQFLGITLIIGGFPCQDISAAGKGAGLEGERSGLWFEYLRIIKECQPRFVVAENVDALLGRGLDRVLSDMEEAGYAVEALSVAASDMGAPHQRKRWFIVGERLENADSAGSSPLEANPGESSSLYASACPPSQAGVALGDSCGGRLSGKPRRGAGSEPTDGLVGGEKRAMADPESLGQWDECQDVRSGGREVNAPDHSGSSLRGDDRPRDGESLANSDGQRQSQSGGLISDFRRWDQHSGQELDDADRHGCRHPESRSQAEPDSDRQDDGLHSAGSGDGELADTDGSGRGEQRSAEPGGEELASFELQRGGSTEPGMGRAASRLSSGMDFPGLLWPAGKGPYQHEWEAPRTVQGKQPGRPARIKALGNAVVPAQALPVFMAIRQRIEG
jgi:site-specific DNA-cytosine methylase